MCSPFFCCVWSSQACVSFMDCVCVFIARVCLERFHTAASQFSLFRLHSFYHDHRWAACILHIYCNPSAADENVSTANQNYLCFFLIYQWSFSEASFPFLWHHVGLLEDVNQLQNSCFFLLIVVIVLVKSHSVCLSPVKSSVKTA